jgi:hypothetical protein
MRFFAIHTPDGNISSIVGSPATGPVMRPLQLAVGELFSEVRLPPRLFDPANAKSYTRLTEISATYAVEMPLRTPARLVKKSPGTTEDQGKLGSLNIVPNPVTRPQAPRFEVTLKQPSGQAVHVTIVLQPGTPWGPPAIPLGAVSIPAGETTVALSSPIPAALPAGAHTVAASTSANDIVTAVLHVMA